jgi:hypothetical protein
VRAGLAFFTIVSVASIFPNPLAQVGLPGRKSILAQRTVPKVKFDAPAPLRFWHLASLDAPTVAVVWALAFAWAAGVRLPRWVPVLLALVVWAVYVADRLLDARRALQSGRGGGLRERHRFHWRYRRLLEPLASSAAVAAACIVVALVPAASRDGDTVVGVAALAYFARVHSGERWAREISRSRPPIPTKEFFVGVLFTAGCALPAWNRAGLRAWPLLLPVAYFAVLAWLNCHAIERWEAFGEARAGGNAIARAAALLGVAGIVAAVALFAFEPRLAALLFAGAAAALLLAWLDCTRGRLTPLALRAAADLVLLTPLALLLK